MGANTSIFLPIDKGLRSVVKYCPLQAQKGRSTPRKAGEERERVVQAPPAREGSDPGAAGVNEVSPAVSRVKGQ